MKLCIAGTGYVGLVSGACFAEMGNAVHCVDTDEEKISMLRSGGIPIYEPGLEKLVKTNVDRGTLHFTTSIEEAVAQTDIVFIAVGTPPGEDGSADLKYVLQVAKSIGEHMVHRMIVVDKSTVPVGTADKVKDVIRGELDRRGSDLEFSVVSNPEFLKEGAAVADCMRPERVVIGTDDEWAVRVMEELYAPFLIKRPRVVSMDVRSAEMTKYAANAMLATKISFMNEMAGICEKVGADVNKVRIGIGSDSRIGFSFIYPGCGYGGSCFPKDVQALIRIAAQSGYEPRILAAVERVNNDQKRVLAAKIVKRFGEDLAGKVFAVWGLAFKPGTDDMREAPSLAVIEELVGRGALIRAYDPQAMEQARDVYLKGNKSVEYFSSKYDALDGAHAMILVTEWNEFRSPDFREMARRMKGVVIFDGRNQYSSDRLKELGFEHFQIGVK